MNILVHNMTRVETKAKVGLYMKVKRVLFDYTKIISYFSKGISTTSIIARKSPLK